MMLTLIIRRPMAKTTDIQTPFSKGVQRGGLGCVHPPTPLA